MSWLKKNHNGETISQPDTTIWIVNLRILRNHIKVKRRLGIRRVKVK